MQKLFNRLEWHNTLATPGFVNAFTKLLEARHGSQCRRPHAHSEHR
jgi:hypothetical protein